jgi:hypothetical protein
LFVLIQTQSLVNFTNSRESNQWEHDSFTKFPIENATYEFEQILKEDPTYILMQNILTLEQIIDDDNQSITNVPC